MAMKIVQFLITACWKRTTSAVREQLVEPIIIVQSVTSFVRVKLSAEMASRILMRMVIGRNAMLVCIARMEPGATSVDHFVRMKVRVYLVMV